MMNNKIGRNCEELNNNELNQVAGGIFDGQRMIEQREVFCLAEDPQTAAAFPPMREEELGRIDQ